MSTEDDSIARLVEKQATLVGGSSATDGPRAAGDDLVGATFAHFKILGMLGSGGMGKVYRARNLKLDCVRALKVLDAGPSERKDDDSTRRLVQRFLREARAAAKLEHDHIVRVHDADAWGQRRYIEMEFVDGPSLDQLIRDCDGLPAAEATRIVRQVALALQAAHDAHEVHRDVKPSNVLLTKSGRAKLSDFGLAKNVNVPSDLTLAGEILGTPAYMSPEQCRGAEATHLSDIYSLGILYYQTLTGSQPYTGSALEMIESHKTGPLPDPRPHCPHVTDACWAIIQKMTAIEPSDRYAGAARLIADLDRVLAGQEVDPLQAEAPLIVAPSDANLPSPEPARAGDRKRRGWIMVAGATALALALALLAPLMRRDQADGEAGAAKPQPGVREPLEIRMSIRAQRRDERGNMYTVVLRPGDVLLSGDQFQIDYELSRDAQVCVLLYAATGQVQRLFPGPGTAAVSFAKRGVLHVLPSPSEGFTLDENIGLETVCLLAYETPPSDLDKLVQAARDAGAIPASEREQMQKLALGKLQRDVGGVSPLYVPQVSEARVAKVLDVIRKYCPRAVALTFRHENP